MDIQRNGSGDSKTLPSDDRIANALIDRISEMSLLSIALTDEGYNSIQDPEGVTKFFYFDDHRETWKRMLEIIDRYGSHDTGTITQNVTEDQAELLMRCNNVNPVGLWEGVGEYVDAFLGRLKTCWQRRKVYQWMQENDPWTWDRPSDQIERTQEYLDDVRLQQRNLSIEGTEDGLGELREIIENKGDDGLPKTNMRTSYTALDRATYGIAPTDLWMLSAKAGVGKTTFALQLANFVADQYGDVLIISGEMEPHEICMKMIARNQGLSMDRMMREDMQNEDWEKYVKGEEKIFNANLHILSQRRFTIYDIASSVRQINRQNDLRLVILDYFQLVQNHRPEEMKRFEFYDYFSVWLTEFTSDMKVPFFCISRENRDDGIYGTTQPDYDCNYHLKMVQPEEETNERLIHVEKARLGPGGTIRLELQGQFSRFIDPDLSEGS